MTTFSVIIPTRNRAALFRVALDSVLAQTAAAFEVIVVNDGTSGEDAIALNAIKAAHAGEVTFVDLPVTGGHGCFAVMNTGAMLSRGEYLCFLDDDDCWTDPGHLAHADRIAQRDAPPPDAMFFDQAAYRDDVRAPGPIWLDDLGARLIAAGEGGDAEQGFAVAPATFLTAHGFAHTNTIIVHRDIFRAIGGFDTGLRYEGDRDFFLRLIDVATRLRYTPTICARHNIPTKASVSTTTSSLDKALDQVRLLHKATRHAKHADIVAYGKRHRRYALRRAIDAALSSPALFSKLAKFLPTLLAAPEVRKDVRVVATTDAMITLGRRVAG